MISSDEFTKDKDGKLSKALLEATCPLCLALKNEIDDLGDNGLWTEDDKFAIIRTKDDKGHNERWMITTVDHRDTIAYWEESDAKMYLFEFMKEYMMNFTIMEPTHASIPDHFHLVASTLDFGNDWDQIKDTDRIEVYFRQREKGYDSD